MNSARLTEMRSELSNYGISLGFKQICAGDEEALLPEETDSFLNCAEIVRRQSGAARSVARALLAKRGYDRFALPRRLGLAPIWPPGIVGSLAHCEDCATAAVADSSRISGVGIDIEPGLPLPNDVFNFIATPYEHLRFLSDSVQRRALFCAKEAAFKAAYALDGVPMEFYDIEIDEKFQIARTGYGREVGLRVLVQEYIVGVGIVPKII